MAVAPSKPSTVPAPAYGAPARGTAWRTPSSTVHIFEPRRSGIHHSLLEAWRFRRFSSFFGKRFMEKRYAQTWLGMFWLPLRPGISLTTRIFVYGGLIGIAANGVPYALAFLVGTAAWQLFYEGVLWSVRSIQINRRTVKDIYMPRSLLVASAVIPAFVDFLVNISFVVIAVVYYVFRVHTFYVQFGVRTLLAPAGLMLMLLMGLGVGMMLAGVGARGRDLQFSLPFVLNFIYFLTPIIYPLTQLPASYRPYAELNPMTGAVEMVKDGFFRTHTLSGPAAIVSVTAVLILWGPLHWYADRREVRLLTGPAADADGVSAEPAR